MFSRKNNGAPKTDGPPLTIRPQGRHDEISFLTGDTEIQMNSDGTCVKHPFVKLRETTEDGYTYQRDVCPQCEAELEDKMERLNLKGGELDRRLEDLEEQEQEESEVSKAYGSSKKSAGVGGGGSTSSKNHLSQNDEEEWTHPNKLSLEALSTQMNRMQQMQDWLLQQKEQEMTMLRQKVEEQQRELLQKEVEMALLKEKLAQQEQRMQHELKLIKHAASKHHRKKKKKKDRESSAAGTTSKSSSSKKSPPPISEISAMDASSPRSPSKEYSADGAAARRSHGGDSVGELPMKSQAYAQDDDHLQQQDEEEDEYEFPVKKAPPPPIAEEQNHVGEDEFEDKEEQQDSFNPNFLPNYQGVPVNIHDNGVGGGGGPSTVPLNEQITMGSEFNASGGNWGRAGGAGGAGGDNTDAYTIGNTVATSTYGEDRHKVVDQKVLDPYGDSGQYTGVVLLTTGMPHGLGRMLYEDDGRTYEGDWRHGRWHGYGKATFANGDAYEGEYRFDQRHGRGIYQWSDGRIYDGDFYEDKRHGRGTFKWPDGAIYEGDFVHGQREGHGRYTFSDGGQYVGDWVDGRYEGYGECEWEDGRSYKGEWKQGMAHGRGVETFADGTVRHDGLWDHDDPIHE